MFTKILSTILRHKFIAGFVILGLVIGSYFAFKGGGATQAKYVFAAVEKGTIVTSITGSGQVSVSNQMDVKPKVSGDIIYVGVKNGQEVRAGTLLAQIDTGDAQKAVRDAQISLESAQLQLEKLKLNQGRDSATLENNIENAQDAITSSYEEGFNKISDAFLDLPDILTGIRGILYDSTVGSAGQINTGAYQDLMDPYNKALIIPMINRALADYLTSSEKYNKNLDGYKGVTRYSPSDQVVSLINETLETAKTMSQTVKDEQNILDAVVLSLKQYQSKRPIPMAIIQYQSDISGYIGKLNGFISGLLNIQNVIKNAEQKLEDARLDLDMAKKFNPFDVVSQENTVKQKEVALADAQEALSNCYIRAPFGGIVSEVNVKKGDSVSGSVVVATMITKQQVAEVTLNEIDVAKIKAGQKATLTFDAAPDLSVVGEVAEVDALGTISQGVVSYVVKITSGTQNEQIKPGMSVSAAIITDTKLNVLFVPNSAVKSVADNQYVETPADNFDRNQLLANISSNISMALPVLPVRQSVETGLSNDSVTEITSGLKEGDIVVVRTITSTSGTTTQTQTRSLFPTTNTRGGGGGGAIGR